MSEPPSKPAAQVTLARGASASPKGHHWVQVPRSSMEALAELMSESASAAKVLLKITAQMGEHNAFVASNSSIADMTNLSVPTVKRSLKLLQERRWINILRLGSTQSVRVIVVNDQVAWHGPRKGLRNSLFSATVYVAEDEQDAEEIAGNGELHQMPDIRPGEGQIPSGDGLPPPSSPSLPGMEAPLPVRSEETQSIGDILSRLEALGPDETED